MRPILTGTSLVAGLALGLAASAAQAHDLWVNAQAATSASGEVETTAVVTSMGWGHQPLPIAEFLPADRIETYAIVAPDGMVMPLPFDASLNANVNVVPEGDTPAGLTQMQGGDVFARRLVFDHEEAQSGGWRVHAALPARVFSRWIDEAGEEVSGARFEDEIEGEVEMVSSTVTVRSADAYWAVGEWSEPAPADVPLQLIPMTDLSALSAGDEVTFAVHRDGERVTPPEDAAFGAFSATGEAEGTIDENGELRITLSEPGIWIIRSSHQEALSEAGAAYADLEGRAEEITFTATVALEVSP